MNEYMGIKGTVNYYHIPYREDGFSYCKHCKSYADKLLIEFHEGWTDDWMQVICSKCNKTIWVCHVNKKKFIKDDKKCLVCGKPTNHYDCSSMGGNIHDEINYWCSKQCSDKWSKIAYDSNDTFLEELSLCANEQGYSYADIYPIYKQFVLDKLKKEKGK